MNLNNINPLTEKSNGVYILVWGLHTYRKGRAAKQEEIEKQQRNENTLLPLSFDYNEIPGLSREVISKLNDFKPETIGKALRISGVTPAAISILLVHLKKRGLLVRDKGNKNES